MKSKLSSCREHIAGVQPTLWNGGRIHIAKLGELRFSNSLICAAINVNEPDFSTMFD